MSGFPHNPSYTLPKEEKMKYPNVIHLDMNWINRLGEVQTQTVTGKYVPARPSGYPSFRHRIRAAWVVFSGKADALIWPADQ